MSLIPSPSYYEYRINDCGSGGGGGGDDDDSDNDGGSGGKNSIKQPLKESIYFW